MSYSKKIAIVNSQNLSIYVYHNLPYGGGYRTLTAVKKYLRSKKIRHKILSSEYMNQVGGIFNYVFKAYIYSRLYEKYLSNKIDRSSKIIVYQSWLINSPYILRYLKCKKMYICHEPLREFIEKSSENINILARIKRYIFKLIKLPLKKIEVSNARHSDIIIANSQYSKSVIDCTYKYSSKVVYPGYDSENFYHQKIKKKNQVISVGSINDYKNQISIINFLAKISIIYRPELLLVCNGYDIEYKDKLIKLARKCNVKVTIKYSCDDKTLRKHYNQSKLFLFNPKKEPFGIVVLEAMACGLPVICNKNGGGYTEIIDSRNGILIDAEDINTWAHSIERMLVDNKIREKIGEYNIDYVRQFSDRVYSENVYKLLKSL